MSNPFENETTLYYVLTNTQGQHSLWPESISVPNGWGVAYGPDSRTKCRTYIEENWTDMRPVDLINTMAKII